MAGAHYIDEAAGVGTIVFVVPPTPMSPDVARESLCFSGTDEVFTQPQSIARANGFVSRIPRRDVPMPSRQGGSDDVVRFSP